MKPRRYGIPSPPVALAWIILVATVAVAGPVRGEDPLALVAQMEGSYAQVRDYTAILKKRERVHGVLRDQEVMQLKYLRPFRVYLRWLDGPKEGREVLYVEGAYGDRLLVYDPSGIRRFFTLLMSPHDDRAMQESRHPITDIGIGRLIEVVAQTARRAWSRGELRLIDHGPGKESGRPVWRYEGILPDDPGKGYFCARLLLAVDRQLGLPVRIQIFEWDGALAGDYAYTNLRVNPGLTAEEFDPANPAYQFPRWRLTLS
jgi:outer membrane lipoprotein-sorting protein